MSGPPDSDPVCEIRQRLRETGSAVRAATRRRWNQWIRGIERDFRGTPTDRLRGLVKFALTWLLLPPVTGVVVAVLVQFGLSRLSVPLFDSYLDALRVFTLAAMFLGGRAVAAKIADEF